MGEIIDPDYITNRHGDLLKKAGLYSWIEQTPEEAEKRKAIVKAKACNLLRLQALMAERAGFEPACRFRQTDFELFEGKFR